jgi:hypothetical protein
MRNDVAFPGKSIAYEKMGERNKKGQVAKGPADMRVKNERAGG